MAEQYDRLEPRLVEFIAQQQMYFVASAGADGPVNLSPKGMDSLRVLDKRRIAWLNLTGSGNETAAHIQENGRMTLMFCSFAREPQILRLYGQAEEIRPSHVEWSNLYHLFPATPGARQIFVLALDLAQTSCGFAVPRYTFEAQRDTLSKWAIQKGAQGLRQYWQDKNRTSLGGKPIAVDPLEEPPHGR